MRSNGFLEGLIIGCVGMYFLDPSRGRTRRVVLRDRLLKRTRTLAHDLEIMSNDFNHRLTGAVAESRHLFSSNHASPDVLQARIRADLGRVASNASKIVVGVRDGEVYLAGDVLADEVEAVVHCARRSAGHLGVRNAMRVHRRNDHFPGLAGSPRPDSVPPRWTPASSLVMSCVGAGMLLAGSVRKGLAGGILSAAGTGIFLKAFEDVEHRKDPLRRRKPFQVPMDLDCDHQPLTADSLGG